MLANVGIERAVIAGICKHKEEVWIELSAIGITRDSFTTSGNRALFESLMHLLDNKEDITTASLFQAIKELSYLPLFNSRKDVEYIDSLFNFPVSIDNAVSFAVKLEKLAVARKAINKHRQAIETLEAVTGNESIDEIIQLSEDPIFDLVVELNKSKESGPHLLFENVEEVVQYLRDNPCDNIGIPTPWPSYNAAIGSGLRRGGVHLMGARPKIGKTTMAKEALLHFTNVLKMPALFLDTEMVQQDQLIRSVASVSQVPLYAVESGRFGDNHLYNQQIDDAVVELKKNDKLWYESVFGKSFEEILAIIRRWIVKCVGFDEDGNTNNCVVIYDYFKLMDRNQLDNLQEYQAMGFQISKLTDFCKEYDFTCLAFVQLNRQRDISQSDRLRWLCNSYSTFDRKQPEEIAADFGAHGGNRKLTMEDTRFGPGIEQPGEYICLNFQRNINKITEIGLRSTLSEPETTETFEIIEGEDPPLPPDIEDTPPWEE